MSRVLFCPRCRWESVPLSPALAARALTTGLKWCQNCLALDGVQVAMQERRVREIGLPETPAPKVEGDVVLPVNVRPAGMPDTEVEKRDALTRIYRRFFGRGRDA